MPKADTPPGFKPLKDTALFSPLKLGSINLEHRIVQAPLTRMRAVKESDGVYIPGDLHVKYYSQRASKGGLQITEATDIAKYASGYPSVPGIFTASQIAAWSHVTSAVHAKGGHIFLQLWHTGRASPPSFRGGAQPVSSSTLPMPGSWLDGTDCAAHPPRELTVDEIKGLVKDWGQAARNAIAAGFDGVEVHAANGYLLEQFLHDNVNVRTDGYGGGVEGRCRFVMEVLEGCCKAVGAEKVGVRLSPWNYFQGTRDSDPVGCWGYLCGRIREMGGLAYVHMIEPRFDETLSPTEKLSSLSSTTPTSKPSLLPFRTILSSPSPSVTPSSTSTPSSLPSSSTSPPIPLLSAGSYTRLNALPAITSGATDLVVFGRWFISNPDLPERLREGWELSEYDRSTFYGAEPPERGYVDYGVYGDGVA